MRSRRREANAKLARRRCWDLPTAVMASRPQHRRRRLEKVRARAEHWVRWWLTRRACRPRARRRRRSGEGEGEGGAGSMWELLRLELGLELLGIDGGGCRLSTRIASTSTSTSTAAASTGRDPRRNSLAASRWFIWRAHQAHRRKRSLMRVLNAASVRCLRRKLVLERSCAMLRRKLAWATHSPPRCCQRTENWPQR